MVRAVRPLEKHPQTIDLQGGFQAGCATATSCMPSLLARWDSLAQDALAVSLLVVGLALVGVLLALGQNRVDEPRELVRKGGDGFGYFLGAGAQAHPGREYIAEQLDVGRVQVSRWRERYAQSRLEGIERDLPRGAPPMTMDVARS